MREKPQQAQTHFQYSIPPFTAILIASQAIVLNDKRKAATFVIALSNTYLFGTERMSFFQNRLIKP